MHPAPQGRAHWAPAQARSFSGTGSPFRISRCSAKARSLSTIDHAPKIGALDGGPARYAELRDALGKVDPRQIAVAQDKPSIYVSIALDQARITIDGAAVDRYTAIDF